MEHNGRMAGQEIRKGLLELARAMVEASAKQQRCLNPLTIFLDIDGVLRRTSAPKYKLESDLVANLERWVRVQEKEVEIVISSTWKDAFPLDHIRSLFPLALRVKIVGRTPTLTGSDYPRFDEVKAYNIKHRIEEWIAFDDQPDLFPPGLSNVVAIDGEIGFQ